MKKYKKKAVFILDTSAFLSGRPLDFEKSVLITTSSIENEINPGGRDYQNLQYLKEIGLILKKPSSESEKRIQNISKKTGDYERLSDFDREILAIALDEQKLQSKVIILTDDYSIQNIASSLKIMFESINQKGITKKFKWITRCIGCGKKFKDNINICPICGSETKKTVHKTEEIKE